MEKLELLQKKVDLKRQAMEHRDAIRLMYQALMQIGAVEFGKETRTAEIVANTLRQMNVEYTALVQEALGIGKHGR